MLAGRGGRGWAWVWVALRVMGNPLQEMETDYGRIAIAAAPDAGVGCSKVVRTMSVKACTHLGHMRPRDEPIPKRLKLQLFCQRSRGPCTARRRASSSAGS